MGQGWVYVLVNSSMPGLVKVGCTTRPPAERAAELSAATGVATPFVLAFEQEFPDCWQAEQDIHAALDARGLRVAANREFFCGPAAEIVRVVLHMAAEPPIGPDVPLPGPSAQELLAEGERHLLGEGETFEDVAEACRYFRQAAARGSIVAPERLGAVFAQRGGRSPTERRRALRHLNDGARRGNYYCFVEIAALYAAKGHGPNFAKAWDKFFAGRAARYCDEAEAGKSRYVVALLRYVCGCIDLKMHPLHAAEIVAASEQLIDHVRQLLAPLRDVEQRARLVGALRFTYELPLASAPEPRRRQFWRLFGHPRHPEAAQCGTPEPW